MIAHKHVFVVNRKRSINREHSTLLVTVNTFCACVYFAAIVGKLSYLVIVLIGHTMVVNI